MGNGNWRIAFTGGCGASIAAAVWPTYYGGMAATSIFQIKICGITSAGDALVAAQAGADAIGLNFWPQSRRFISVKVACEIVATLPSNFTKVGVFVNSTPADIAAIVDAVGLDWIQLHGDEPPELLAKLPPQVPILRAFRCGEKGLTPLTQYLTASKVNGRAPDAVLIDADAAGDFGGTGRVADWARIARHRRHLGSLPLILAGGLTPQNVPTAIAAIRPDGVDVASGVESRPGFKDAVLIENFVAAACAAFDV
jgi:phosphoribosylanthranilate isomerase